MRSGEIRWLDSGGFVQQEVRLDDFRASGTRREGAAATPRSPGGSPDIVGGGRTHPGYDRGRRSRQVGRAAGARTRVDHGPPGWQLSAGHARLGRGGLFARRPAGRRRRRVRGPAGRHRRRVDAWTGYPPHRHHRGSRRARPVRARRSRDASRRGAAADLRRNGGAPARQSLASGCAQPSGGIRFPGGGARTGSGAPGAPPRGGGGGRGGGPPPGPRPGRPPGGPGGR